MTSDKIVSKTININATASKVWEALTNPDLLKLWMSDAEIEIISNWTVGSPIVIRGNVNGSYEYKGTVLQFEKEKFLQYNSWTKISRLQDKPENYSLVEFKLTTMKNQTTLTITHSNLKAKAAYEHSNFYWASALEVMKKIIEK